MLVKFESTNKDIVFCFVDKTHSYPSTWTQELIKNQADYTISNLTSKGYSVLEGQDENVLLINAVDLNFKYAVVFSTGTEFINGENFIEEIKLLFNKDFFIAGHILDRKEAYYELHHQCFVVNLEEFKKLNIPEIGYESLGSSHQQYIPNRSQDNIHDDYTPLWVSSGNNKKVYNHKCHGWNILSTGFNNNKKMIVFDENVRNNKKHFYPENKSEFFKHVQWAYKRQNFCLNEFLHITNTEKSNFEFQEIEQIVTPASGLWWIPTISKSKPVTVVLYDYNQCSLDYWEKNVPAIENVSYKFIKVDLLNEKLDLNFLDKQKPTLINLSNIFCYEGTSFFYSLEYRVFKENEILNYIADTLPDAIVNFSCRAALGFQSLMLFFKADIRNLTDLKFATKPTWHWRDWL